jgi:hypothetical protein
VNNASRGPPPPLAPAPSGWDRAPRERSRDQPRSRSRSR